MATPGKSLIEILNSAAGSNLSPDQIVARINRHGWVKLTDMTEQQAQLLDQKRCVVGADNGGHPRPFWIVSGSHRENWVFDAASWYPPGPWSAEFWFILFEEYHDGLVPDRFAQ